MVLNTEWAQVEVIDLINDGSGLAFGIIGGRSTGVVVKTILPGGVADRDGRLQSGDHILQIGEVNLRGLGSEQVASVLRQCGIHVRMVVARPIESVSADYQALRSRATVVPTKILGDPVELDKHLIENGYIQSPIYHPRTINPIIYSQSPSIQLHPISEVVDVVRNPRPIGSVPVLKLGENDLPETETYAVLLKKDDLGLGVTVAGYVCEREDISGIFVKSISKGGAADATKKIQVNDRIIEVDGECVIGHTNHHAVELLRNTGPTVRLKLERYLRGPKYESLQQAIKANEYRPPSPPSVTASSLPKVPLSDVRMSYMEIEPEGESRTSFDFDSTILFDEADKEIVIGGEGFNLRDNESIHDKWQKVLGKQAVILIDKIFKESNSGLGISLEGTVEVEDGKELHPRHYIRNILPDGPVGRNEVLQVGDELLEVNGVHLTGLNHLEVVNIFKKLPSYVKLVCARYPVPIRIIDTSQKREAFQSRKIFTGSLQTLVPCSDLLVKAKSESSIASSVASEFCSGSRSRSLELIAGLPMWSNEPTVVELVKGGFGLGFSVLDYQDPLNPQKTVIVIRSLVPGGTAQQDGRLIPGDRLLAVNDINVEHASLDLAVSVLKGVPKGPVRLRVAKPLTINDPVPYTSQLIRNMIQEWCQELEVLWDSEEDRTYLDDFQECFEEYQECLDENPMCTDQLNCASRAKKLPDALENNNLLTVTSDNSDLDLSFKSVQEKPKIECKISRRLNLKTDSWTQSQSSNQDGYDTCVEEESLSEEAPRRSVIEEEVTPTNSRGEPANLGNSTSEPCLLRDNRNVLCLDSKNDGLKSYQDDSAGPDEFFLIQYQVEIPRSYSESSVFDRSKLCFGKKFTFHLEEYYNDYEECLNSINVERHRLEMGDEIIFDEIILPFKCRSVETLFVERLDLETARRKSDFAGQQGEDRQMTVIKSIGNECGAWKGDQMLQKRWGSIHTVQIHREINSGLGITIVGGKVDLEGQDSQRVVGIFVKDVVAGSTAGKTGLFKTGDRILEVSGVDLREATHERAVEAIRSAPDPVVFVIQSLSPWETFDKPAPDAPEDAEQVAQKQDEIVPRDQKGDVPVLDGVINESFRDDSLEESEEEEDVRELEGRTVTTKGQQIDRASAGNVKRTKEEISQDGEEEDDFGYTSNKVKKKYANLGSNIFIVQLERSNQGLGLSLAGHKDRNCMAVFVCGLNPNGAAYKAGGIQIGDEILEVNGVVLHGRCHLNASAIIKSLSGPIFKVIILRRKTAINDIAVKPITQFPVSLAEEASEEQFSASYPNVRTVSVKKGNQSLGIMIIEGKHAEVGQGIFISDIQEGSAAEKAGLEIGEMILAVNKDSLVGSNYETAANLLKRTEGLVTLVVSNPGKRDQSRQTAPLITQCTNNTANTEANRNAGRNAVLKSAGPTSRPATPVPEANVDPAACSVTPGRDVTIEVVTDNKGLGIFFVGGKDTLLSGGIVVVEVYPGGMADQDGRLKPGDQILDVNGTSLKDVTTSIASQALRQTLPKMKMIVYRPERVEYTKLDIDLIKKPGKGLGLSVIARKSGKGVYISDIINGGSVDVDGRIMRGDLLISVNGQSVENCSGDEACVILKTVTGKISLKLHRYKIVAR